MFRILNPAPQPSEQSVITGWELWSLLRRRGRITHRRKHNSTTALQQHHLSAAHRSAHRSQLPHTLSQQTSTFRPSRRGLTEPLQDRRLHIATPSSLPPARGHAEYVQASQNNAPGLSTSGGGFCVTQNEYMQSKGGQRNLALLPSSMRGKTSDQIGFATLAGCTNHKLQLPWQRMRSRGHILAYLTPMSTNHGAFSRR